MKELRDLHRIEGRSFPDLVAHDPEGESVVEDEVFTDSTYEAVILVGAVQWCRKEWLIGEGLVEDLDAIGQVDGFVSCVYARLIIERCCHGDGVRTHDRDTDAGDRCLQVRGVKNFPPLEMHLHLLLGVAVLLKNVDLGDDIGGNLVGIHVALRHRFVVGERVDLLFQLGNALGSAAGYCLVTGSNDARHAAKGSVHRVQCHQGHDGGTVRIGNDAVVLFCVVRVHLGNNQRDSFIEAESRGVVDNDGTCGNGVRSKLRGNATTGTEERDIDALERIRSQLFHGDFFSTKSQRPAGRAGRSEKSQFANRKITLLEALEDFNPHGSGSSRYGDVLGRLVHDY